MGEGVFVRMLLFLCAYSNRRPAIEIADGNLYAHRKAG